ncbi:MAG: DUF4317 domain-containing protein [Clostridiales bacterium]|nr:DUF4317 domain-containing protein [Candidatus Crickella merdequi]
MNSKAIREIKRRFGDEMDNFSTIYGCYVNAAKEIVTKIELPVLDMTKEEKEMYAKLLKKTLSGALGRNLVDIEFSLDQVGNSDEHKLLMALKESNLRNENMRNILYSRIIESINMPETSFVILLIADSYDVPHKGSDGEYFNEESFDMFDYFLCCVCPVKDSKAALKYLSAAEGFRGTGTGSILGAPQVGFMFPSFDDRASNIYSVLYYSRSSAENHEELIETLFNAPVKPMSAEKQMYAFSGALEEALEEECSIDVVKQLQSLIRTNLEEHKESKDPEAPQMFIEDVQTVLRENGVSEQRVDDFKDTCIRYFDNQTILNPRNLMNSKTFEIKTQEVTVKVDPDHAYQVTTRTIDGRNYILVPIGEGVTVNGVEITVTEE